MENKLKKYFAAMRHFSNILMNELIDNPSRKDFDLRLSQMNAISAFTDEHPITMKDLANNCMVKLPNMTTMVDSLVDDGLVERKRDPSDRRKVIVCLTPKGKKIRAKFLIKRRAHTRTIFSSLSEKEKKELLSSMEKVCELFEKSLKKISHP